MCFGTSSGSLMQLLHFGPLIAIFLISYITLIGFYNLLQWWPPNTIDGQIHVLIYCTWPIIIFYNYFNAIFIGPGFVPKNWKPDKKEDEEKLQYCKICESFKVPRSHHCRKCNRCVFKMDHHCPWINTCCGHFNHAYFVYFLFYAPLGCIHALLVLGASIYRAIFRNYYIFYNITDVPLVQLNFIGVIMSVFGFGMAFGVTIAVGILFYIQIKSIVKNQTGIEAWILKKAIYRRENSEIKENFIYPYDLGLKENLRQVFNWNGKSRFRPIGDGIIWNVNEFSDQFTLTVEQLEQKKEKQIHSVKYNVINNYSGSFITFKHGCKTLCCFPWTEDPRLLLFKNETVHVTRWQKHWLYGEIKLDKSEKEEQEEKTKIVSKHNRRNSKGWFPSNCVHQIKKANNDDSNKKTD